MPEQVNTELDDPSTQCYIFEGQLAERMREKKQPRFFKTRAFAKLAIKIQILDEALWRAGMDLTEGKGDNLGGNVWRKRLNKNLHRSIIVEKAGDCWFFIYLYAKSQRENIDQTEEAAFKRLAKLFASMSSAQLDDQIKIKELLEIVSNDDQPPLQE